MLPVGSSCDSKILGLLWDAARDQLAFSTSMCRVPTEVRAQTRAPTKREALSAVMSIFDPLGLLSHFSITAKILLQDLWRMRLDWDEPLPEEEAATFGRWLRALDELDSLQITRCYDPTQGHRQLHVFCDASEVAYAAAAYWRVEHPDGSIAVTLAAAKSKVAPIKALSIPRLELQAAVIGTRLADMVQREHRWKPESVHYWTDSRTVLQWIAKDARRYSPFVAHRLGEIAEYTDAEAWRWVPTAMNVADDATRPNFSPGTSTNRWFVGPDFLRGPDSEWPAPIQPSEESAETYASHAVPISPYLPDISRISRYETLVRATAVVLAFLDRCRKRAQQVELRHIERAERLWVQQVQAESFATEIECLRHGSPISPSSRLFHLSPILEDGVLRLDGRISAATAPPAAKRPIILDGRHLFTTLLVQREHEAAQHANNERVVNNLRQKYHILHLRPTVKRVARSCARCMVTRSMPRTPPIGDLPRARLDPFTRPFSNCGVDYFGPMVVTVGRRHEKRWGALFTCLTTRAVHLELVASLSADSAIMALRRMAARRGWPKTIYSDNGTNFRGADAELRAAYADWEPAFQDEALRHRTEWRFIPPGAPNQGGAWERLVRSVKTALKAVLHQQFPREELLQTLLAEAEHSVNSRPLTHVSVDLRDPEALTPNHFLLGSSEGLPSTGPCQPTDLRAWRRVQALADSFWRRWVQEYLPTLVPRSSSPSTERNLQVGDLVIVVDHSLPRNTWPRGRVVATFPGPDGAVRSASVQTKGGKPPKVRIPRRPPIKKGSFHIRRGETVADSEESVPLARTLPFSFPPVRCSDWPSAALVETIASAHCLKRSAKYKGRPFWLEKAVAAQQPPGTPASRSLQKPEETSSSLKKLEAAPRKSRANVRPAATPTAATPVAAAGTSATPRNQRLPRPRGNRDSRDSRGIRDSRGAAAAAAAAATAAAADVTPLPPPPPPLTSRRCRHRRRR
ncbi:unnamed protein product [Plutella xylostella]|uniref:(diamondback moth) hypothetical protein n=1 Tax=Plutella xylostella TaxID=51655 RepID=A0A8S4F350_PLUXY|nr:unnamed protein product [Plutella xylostella]